MPKGFFQKSLHSLLWSQIPSIPLPSTLISSVFCHSRPYPMVAWTDPISCAQWSYFPGMNLLSSFLKKKLFIYSYFSYKSFGLHVCLWSMFGTSRGIRSSGIGVYSQLLNAIWVLGSEPGSSTRAISGLSHWLFSPAFRHGLYDPCLTLKAFA